MWKTEIIIILIILLFGGLVLQISASNSYLPKADLIKGTGPEVYILENGVRHWIPSPEIFEHFQYKWANIKILPDNLLRSYPLGTKLSKYSKYPDGTLLKGSGPEVYLIELGKRRWIPTPRVFEASDFGWKYIIEIDDKKLSRIKQGDNLTLIEPSKYPETIILKGPQQGETLEEAEITIKYSGKNPLGRAKDLRFETFLEGYDKRWRSQYSGDSRTYKLPKESGIYTVYVRAKNKQGYVDPTPASRSFQVGVSPYYRKVEIKKVRAKMDDFEKDYLVLRNKDKETIRMSNWTIEMRGTTINIPQAIKNLRYPFSSDNNSDIELAYRNEVIISAGFSPSGINFQLNKCTGYLDQMSQFYPSLDKDCPYLEESEYRHLKKACRDFIDDLRRCQLPDYSDNFVVQSDSQCTSFLNDRFNYKRCYEDYYQEIDFCQDEWRVFLNKSIDIFDNDGDRLILRDGQGLVVDEYEY